MSASSPYTAFDQKTSVDGLQSSDTTISVDGNINNYDGSNKDASYGVDAEGGTAGIASSGINLLKSILGSGILSLPASFATVGVIPAISLLGIAAVLALAGLHLLVLTTDRLAKRGLLKPPRSADFTQVTLPIYPRLCLVFEAAVFFKCLLVCSSYMTVAVELLMKLMALWFPNTTFMGNTLLLVTIATLLVTPVTFLRKMDSLKYTSFVGLGGVVFLLGISLKMLFFPSVTETTRTPLEMIKSMELFKAPSVKSLSVFASFVFALNCHQNIFSIYNEIKDNRPKAMFPLLTFCIMASSLIYAIFGLTLYAVLGDSIQSNAIKSLPDTALYNVARVFYVLLMLVSFPLQAFPARSSLLKLVKAAVGSSRGGALFDRMAYSVATVFILAFSWLVAWRQISLELLVRLVGCTAGPLICYFLPGLFWLKLETEKRPLTRGKVMAWSLIIFGVLAVVIPLTSIIINLIKN